MRVAFLVYDLEGPGGMQRQATQLAARLVARGLRLRFVSTAAPRDLPARAGRQVPGLPDIPVLRLPTTRPPLFEAAARVWLAGHGGADVLYAIGWNAALHALRIGERTGAPVVVKYACAGPHGDFAAVARTDGAAALLAKAARHVAISQAIRDEALAAGLPAERVVTISNGVDLAAWAAPAPPAALPWTGASRPVLFLGRLAVQKRVDVLLDAFARLLPRVPEARLALCGEGPLRRALEEQARGLGLGDRAAFLGQRDDVPALLRAARAFVLPSDGEGVSNALLEALAAGAPAVATDVPGTREVARDGVEALLVPPGDAAALADALARVLTDRDLAARLAEAGRARVREAFDLEHVAARYAALFEEVAREAGARRRRLVERLGALVRAARGDRR